MSNPPSLCRSFRRLAGVVWRERGAADLLGVPWNEEAVTEWLLLQLAKEHQGHDLDIWAYGKAEEAQNGADWEFYFAEEDVGVSVRIQAKRLFGSGRYESLFKAGADKFAQLDKLVHKAGSAVPLYVFYNFEHPFPYAGLSSPPDCGNPNFRGPSYWGCSMASPDFVKSAGSDKAQILIDGMKPWHCLVCQCPGCNFGGGGGRPRLPDLVAAGLNRIRMGDSGSASIEPSDEAPDWVRFVREDDFVEMNGAARRPHIDQYLEKRDLSGVALIRAIKPEFREREGSES